MLEERGVTPDKQVITTDRVESVRRQGAFVLTLMGYQRVRNYDGSMGEWANRDNAPLTT